MKHVELVRSEQICKRSTPDLPYVSNDKHAVLQFRNLTALIQSPAVAERHCFANCLVMFAVNAATVQAVGRSPHIHTGDGLVFILAPLLHILYGALSDSQDVGRNSFEWY